MSHDRERPRVDTGGAYVFQRNQMMSAASSAAIDCAIVGGGPAGLTAALYLARFRRSVIVIDAGESRARWIPVVRNLAGFEDGVAGHALIDKMRRQVAAYDVPVCRAQVSAARVVDGQFELTHRRTDADEAPQTLRAARLLIASGIRDHQPPLDDAATLTQRGLLRLCPICDGYEAHDKRVAMIGPAATALSHALYFRTFAREVAVVASDLDTLSDEQRRAAHARAVRLIALGQSATPDATPDQLTITSVDGRAHAFDALYPVMGCSTQSSWFDALRIARDDNGLIVADKHQRTSVAGLYAAGDVVNTLNQICVACGEAAVAASSIHASLPPNPL